MKFSSLVLYIYRKGAGFYFYANVLVCTLPLSSCLIRIEKESRYPNCDHIWSMTPKHLQTKPSAVIHCEKRGLEWAACKFAKWRSGFVLNMWSLPSFQINNVFFVFFLVPPYYLHITSFLPPPPSIWKNPSYGHVCFCFCCIRFICHQRRKRLSQN